MNTAGKILKVGALAAIGGYVLAVGAQPSVIRAGVAGSLASPRVAASNALRTAATNSGDRARRA